MFNECKVNEKEMIKKRLKIRENGFIRNWNCGQDMSKFGNVFREGSYVYGITYSGKAIDAICRIL
mgnify:CR=1 FL=1